MSSLDTSGDAISAMSTPIIEGQDYAPFYCEENVHRLLSRPELAGLDTWAVAVFVPGRSVPLLRQRLGQGPDRLIHWDYHVFALAKGGEGYRILDFDTTLGFCTPARSYLEAVFPEGVSHGPLLRHEILFRVMDGREYCRRLESDRSHMRGPDGRWLEPPPAWPAPGGCGSGSWPLDSILSPSPAGPGRLMDLKGLESFVT